MSQRKNRITLDESLAGKVIRQILGKGLPLKLAISQAFIFNVSEKTHGEGN